MVKKEIIKRHGAWGVYQISDSKWVTPIEYIPKKEEMTMVANEKN